MNKRYVKSVSGFTLIELLVVVLIIGILAAIALPQYQKAVEKSRAAEAVSILRTLRDQQSFCFLEYGYENYRCGQGDSAGNNLFNSIPVEIGGTPDPNCGDPLCGPSLENFLFSVDAFQINAIRKPSHNYVLNIDITSPSNRDVHCSNSDPSRNWCSIVGIEEN